MLMSSEPNDLEWRQHVTGLQAGRGYYLCGYVKAQDVVGHEGATVGGTIGISGTFEQANAGFGSYDWKGQCLSFTSQTSEIDVGCRLGGFGSVATGTLYCDDLSLWPLHSAF